MTNRPAADLLFREDGSVRLPLLAGMAITLAAGTDGCLTRQPTKGRAEAVMEAIRDRVTARGYGMEIRHRERPRDCGHGLDESFGVYLTGGVPEDERRSE